MSRFTRSSTERFRQDDGAVIVEFAAIFVVFAMLLWGLISYGLVFAAQQSLTHAASEATRSAVGLSDKGTARDNIEDVVNEELGWLAEFGGLEFEPQEQTGPDGDQDADDVFFYPCGNRECVRVRITYDWDNHPIVPSILDVATPDTLSGYAVVQFR
jgi:hypothetical protein